MQEFIRTVDTTEAFKFKITVLENELKSLEEELSKCKALFEDKQNEYDNINSVGDWSLFKAKFNKVVGIICIIGFAICFLLSIKFINDNYEFADYTMYSIMFGLTFLFVGIRCFMKINFNKRKSQEERLAAEQKKSRLLNEINSLRSSIQELELKVAKQRSLLKETKDKYMQHMVNQQDLLDKEISAINTASSDLDDTKECPQCAEIIKVKAKICRFCGYRLD